MDFAAIVAFTIVLYVRPQEIFGALAAARPAFVVLAWAGAALFMREGGVKWRDVIRTPHDWVMAIYFTYILWSSGSAWATWKLIYPFVGFYFITVMALNTMRRVYVFLYWWLGCIMFIGIMALLSLIGIDPAGSAEITEASRGRLVFGTSLFNNANALGHSVIVAVPMIYFLLFWRRPVFVKEVGLALLPIPLYCTYRTESKGSFASGFIAILATLTFGRPKFVQVIILAGGLFGGVSAAQFLPRWGELQTASKDEAIQGRVEAFKFGRWATENFKYGVGYKNFVTEFQRKEGEEKARASHSSYNQISAEFGWIGLLLFVGSIYCAARTLVQSRTANEMEERVRRTMFCLVATYSVSSWMIDFGFRAAFFVMIAMVSAFHRLLQDRAPIENVDEWLESEQENEANPVGTAAGPIAANGAGAAASSHVYLAHLKQVRGAGRAHAQTAASGVAPVAPLAGSSTTQKSNAYAPAVADTNEERISGSPFMPWTRLTWVDAIVMYYLMELTLYIRTYAIEDLFAAA